MTVSFVPNSFTMTGSPERYMSVDRGPKRLSITMRTISDERLSMICRLLTV